MKYAFLIPMGYQMLPQTLFAQWLPLQEWLAKNEDGKIIATISANQVEGRNRLLTNNSSNRYQFLENVEWIISVDADIQFTLEQMQQLLNCKEQFVSGWYLSSNDMNKSLVGTWNNDIEGPRLFSPNEIYRHTDIFECDHVAGGFFKIHSSLVRQLEYPFYYMPKYEIGENKFTWVNEDMIFCKNIYTKTGIKPKVIPDLKVGHIKWMAI